MNSHLTPDATRAGTDDVAKGIADLLEVGPGLQRLVQDYLSDTDPVFTGRYFDTLADPDSDTFGPGDLLAPSLLDAEIGGPGVEALLVTRRDEFSALLQAVPSTVSIWDAEHDPSGVAQAMEAATELWNAMVGRRGHGGVRGIGTIRAHKLIALKRPALHPVYDSVVEAWFAPSNGIRFQLADLIAGGQSPRDDLRTALDPNHETGLDELRLLDIAVWMCGSRQRAAATVRERHGVTGLPPGRLPKPRRRR